MKDGWTIMQKCYLDHPELNSACSDAILNLAQLTYDNYLEDSNVRAHDRQLVKEAFAQKALAGLVSDDMKLYALDIIFKK